ncbi:hypothetical protein PLICRDRAFT_48606 [Plicaturopsis crispa FD-325 SS-3]|nr:hypothetical protein PLICRDRAFT_48606 [Plicaturopsis crispa FD-325 SS-3]
MSNLDGFVRHSKSQPAIFATSQEIRDRSSTFVGTIYRASTPQDAQKAIRHLKNVVHGSKPPTHAIAAWRCMVLKPGRTGLAGPDDFEVQSGCDDDKEDWAGGKVLNVMKAEAVMDAVVIVSRWYGGIMLGPVRFAHIETCAREVCKTYKKTEEMDDCVATLETLDALLAEVRAKLSTTSPSSVEKTASSSETNARGHIAKKSDYSALRREGDLSKARRLVTAREKAVQHVKAILAKQTKSLAETKGPLTN